jgi:CelD/BcsL family acetyltransferase involved in cellulose biosynthesis
MTVVRVSGVASFSELGERWRDLERRTACSFFQSWTWVGCLAAERYADPILVEATDNGRVVALALFNRVRPLIGPPQLYLHESGNPERDCPYVEQNGVLAEVGREAELTALCLASVVSAHDVTLSGIGAPALAAVQQVAGLVLIHRSQASPFVDLRRHRGDAIDYLAARSANTRQQIRRSGRFYERSGPITLHRPRDMPDAQAMLDEMAVLHQATWTARGQSGSFAHPFFRRFHHALVASGFPRGEIALLKMSGAGQTIGILYNFVHQGRMSAYQSGFAYQDSDTRAKPGLSCHHQAIRLAIAEGIEIYDFLAGEDRYKRSLADGAHRQVWVRAGSRRSIRLLLARGLAALRRPAPRAVTITGQRVSGMADHVPGQCDQAG